MENMALVDLIARALHENYVRDVDSAPKSWIALQIAEPALFAGFMSDAVATVAAIEKAGLRVTHTRQPNANHDEASLAA